MDIPLLLEKRPDVLEFPDHRAAYPGEAPPVPAADHGICDILFRRPFNIIDRGDLLHLPFQEANSDLFLRSAAGLPRVRAAGFCEDHDLPQIVEIRPAGTTHHLGKFLHLQPRDPHRKGVKDDLGCREVHPCRKGCGGDDRSNIPVFKQPLHLAPLLRRKTRVVGHRLLPDGLCHRMASGPGIGEDNRLSLISLGRGLLKLLKDQLLDETDLLLSFGKDEMAFQTHRPLVIPDELTLQFFCQKRRRPDGGTQKEELRIRGNMPEAGNEPVEPVAPFRVLKHLHLINDNRPHLRESPAHPQVMVHALVGADDDVGLHTAPGLHPCLRNMNT